MSTQTEAERLAEWLERRQMMMLQDRQAAAELRRLVSFNQQLMDEVARLQKAVADEREACAKVCESEWSNVAERMYGDECAAAIRARGNL